MHSGPAIVCGIDDSAAGLAAARVAADLADRIGLCLVAAHAVLPIPVAAAGIPYPVPDAGAAARSESASAKHAEAILDAAGADEVRLRTAVGQPAEVLIRVGDEEDAEMLVLGTHEAGTLRTLVGGGVTESVLQSAGRPVLAVPEDAGSGAAGPVLAALGGPGDATWIAHAEMLALARGGGLLLAHVIEDDEDAADPALAEAQARVEAFDPALRALGATEAMVETRIGFGPPGDALLEIARAREARMIVTGSHDHGRLHAALAGSTARQLIHHAGVPVLVCPTAGVSVCRSEADAPARASTRRGRPGSR